MQIKSSFFEVLEANSENEHIALIAGEEQLSYREMIRRSKQIGRALVKSGVRKGDRILHTMNRNADSVCAILGIFYAGGVFVATDNRWPEERMTFIKSDTESVLTLDDVCCLRLLEEETERVTLPEVAGEDVAAIVYTSGSTGVPKGTVILHKSLQAFVDLDKLDDDTCATAKTFMCMVNFAYVVALLEIVLAFNYGKTVLFSTDEELASPMLLAKSMNDHEADFLSITPSVVLRLSELPFFKEPIKRIKALAVTGEKLTQQMGEKLSEAIGGTLWIHYGSTEMGQCASFRWRSGEDIRMGHRAEGVKIYLLDENGEEVGPGEEGEIMISGPAADGGYYLNQPELTRKKYPVHPRFGRLFRTGDYGRRTEDGDITIIGRKDGMVKLSGQRIEVEELEAAIESYPGIHRAAVCIQKKNEREALRAFYTAELEIDERGLREYLAKTLPRYMIPAFLQRLEAMPETVSGKLNRRMLPEIEFGKKELPLVSVLTPVHNADLMLLERAAASIRAQEYEADRIQWIVGIHNMDEACRKELEEVLSGKTNHMVVFSLEEPTKKLGAIRNALLEHAEGEYLFWLDADDELLPGCIRRAVETMELSGAELVRFPFREEVEEGVWYVSRRPGITEQELCVYQKKDPRIGECFAGGGIELWTWGYRTDFLKEIGIRFDTSEYSALGDLGFLIQAVSEAKQVAMLPGEEGYVYYVRAGSDLQGNVSSKKAYKTCLSALQLLEQSAKAEESKNLDLSDWRWTIISHVIAFFSNPQIPKDEKEEIHARLKPWVDSQRAIDPEIAFLGRPEQSVADIIAVLFPEETEKHKEPLFRHRRVTAFPYTEKEVLQKELKERMMAKEFHLIPDEKNPFCAHFKEDALPEIALVNLSKVDSTEKKEAQIRGYIRMEEMRGFTKDEVCLRITEFRMDEKNSELLFTWNERYISEIAADWLTNEKKEGIE